MSRCEVVVLGDINVDVLMSIPAYPQPGEESLAEQIVTRAGGSAANTATVLAKLGVATRMVGRVGGDMWADLALRSLADAGVDIASVQRDERAPTGLFIILVTPDGERTMFGLRGANTRTDPAAISEDGLAGARLLHVSGYALLEAPQRDTALQAIELASQRGVAVSLDTGLQPALESTQTIRRLLSRLSICVLGGKEAHALIDARAPSDAAAGLLARGVRLVGLKLGAEGCLLADTSRSERVPAFQAATIDTTGAGDAFSAGLIFGRLRGLNLSAAGLLANALGSLATTVWGAGQALPGRAEVIALLREVAARSADARRAQIADVLRALGDDRLRSESERA